MKKVISILLCVAMMFTFLTLISAAADGSVASDGSETILGILGKLIQGANWGQIIGILTQSLVKIFQILTSLTGK